LTGERKAAKSRKTQQYLAVGQQIGEMVKKNQNKVKKGIDTNRHNMLLSSSCLGGGKLNAKFAQNFSKNLLTDKESYVKVKFLASQRKDKL